MIIAMFNSGGTTPVFYGHNVLPNDAVNASQVETFDVRISHPACYGFQLELLKESKKIEGREQPMYIKNVTQSMLSLA